VGEWVGACVRGWVDGCLYTTAFDASLKVKSLWGGYD